MNNVKKLFSILCALHSISMQCSEITTTTRNPKTIQELQNDRSKIYKKRLKSEDPSQIVWPLDLVLFQENWHDTLDFIKTAKSMESDTSGNDNLDDLEQQINSCNNGNCEDLFKLIYNINFYKSFNIKKYSCLGCAAIAMQSEKMNNDNSALRGERKKLFLENRPQKQAPFAQKKEFAQELIVCGLKPTAEDEDFALLEKWERCAPSIIKNIFYYRYINSAFMTQIPQDVKDRIAIYIFWLIFNKEESLF